MTLRRFFLLAPTLLVGASAFGQVSFDPAVPYAVGQRPSDSAIADFNGTTGKDVAVTVDNPDRVVILFNNGSGALSQGGTVNLPNGSGAGAIVTADFDGDTDMDLAVALQNSGRVIILLNNGAGVFTTAGTFNVGSNPRGLCAADLNGDLIADLAVANRDSNTASVLINNGSGSFTVSTLAAGAEPRGTALGDLDGDGDADLAVSNHDDRSISLFANNGSGAFSAAGTLSVGGQRRPEGIVAAQLNATGPMDLAAATNGNGFESATVFLATGGMAFSGPVHYPAGGVDTSGISAADMDCNGSPDLITTAQTSGTFSVLQNNGAGAFGAATVVSSGAGPETARAAALNGDASNDVVVANRDSNNITAHMNTTCGGGGYTLSVSGACPGTVRISWSGAQPNGQQGLLYARSQGSFVIPQGQPCAGTTLGLSSNQLRLVTPPGFFSTGNGAGSIAGNASQGACGGFLQLIQGGSCTTSNVAGL